MPHITWELPPEPTSPSAARRLVRLALHEWDAGVFEWAAVTLVSELATNAVLHARTRFTVTLTLDGEVLRLAVTDGSPRLPRRRPYSYGATTGRGVAMLHTMAARTGVDRGPGPDGTDGKTVWCELTSSGARRSWRVDAVEPLGADTSEAAMPGRVPDTETPVFPAPSGEEGRSGASDPTALTELPAGAVAVVRLAVPDTLGAA